MLTRMRGLHFVFVPQVVEDLNSKFKVLSHAFIFLIFIVSSRDTAIKIENQMKKLNFGVLVTLLALIAVFADFEAYGQLTKKEQKALKRQEAEEKLEAARRDAQPSPITISFDSEPQGAKVVVDGKVIGVTPVTARIPINYKEPTGAYAYREYLSKLQEENEISVKFLKNGYVTGEEKIVPNIAFQLISRMVGVNKYTWPNGVFHVFEKDPYAVVDSESNDPDNTIPEGESQKAVSRDNPGQTALERTIIRWYFESEPQGARVYWRVISSVPDQVKPTNESWLGYTPFEETRSFNILGLTYENSRDVQIEIKVRRDGYLDQTKRFNVRQAIDQMEISSFFDMIKKEE